MKDFLRREGRRPSLSFVLRAVALNMALWCVISSHATSPSEALKTLLSSKAIDPDQTAVFIKDVDSDWVVASHNSLLPLTPASVMKCVSTAALATVSPYASTLTTKVWLSGKRSGESFTGRLTAEGAGDPSLGCKRHSSQPDFIAAIVDALKNKGINEFRGDITVDGSVFSGPSTPPSWTDGDREQSYGTGLHGFNFEGNSSGKKSVNNPGALFIKKLSAALEAAGIKFTPENPSLSGAKRQLLLEYKSPQLRELMQSCMFRSDNLYAESFLRLFSLGNGGDGSSQMAAQIAMQHWDALNFNLDGVEIADGSGLSRNNTLTAEFLGNVLENRKDDLEYVSFFPAVGMEGTVAGFMKDTPLQGRLVLKTGSMSGVQSYAGYLLDSDGITPRCVVVVITNNLKNRSVYRTDLSKFFLSVLQD